MHLSFADRRVEAAIQLLALALMAALLGLAHDRRYLFKKNAIFALDFCKAGFLLHFSFLVVNMNFGGVYRAGSRPDLSQVGNVILHTALLLFPLNVAIQERCAPIHVY